MIILLNTRRKKMNETSLIRKIRDFILMDRIPVEFKIDLERCLPKKLTPIETIVFNMRQQGYTYDEIAESLGVTKEMVRIILIDIKRKMFEIYYNTKIKADLFRKLYKKAYKEAKKFYYSPAKKILELYNEGIRNVEDVARLTGVPIKFARTIINHRKGWVRKYVETKHE